MRAASLEAAPRPARYQRRRPEQTPLYRLVRAYYATFAAETEHAAPGAGLPPFVQDEFEAYLDCGILAKGFLRLTCDTCARDTLVAFSCKRRGICPSCGTRRMAETAAYLVDHIIPPVPVRQWVLSYLIPLRTLFAICIELRVRAHAILQDLTLRVVSRGDGARQGGQEGKRSIDKYHLKTNTYMVSGPWAASAARARCSICCLDLNKKGAARSSRRMLFCKT